MSLEVGQPYQHYKGGLYVIESVGLSAETQEEMVAYRSLTDGQVWFHKRQDFELVVTNADHQEVSRFTPIDSIGDNVVHLNTRIDTVGELREHVKLLINDTPLVFCEDAGRHLIPMKARLYSDENNVGTAMLLLTQDTSVEYGDE